MVWVVALSMFAVATFALAFQSCLIVADVVENLALWDFAIECLPSNPVSSLILAINPYLPIAISPRGLFPNQTVIHQASIPYRLIVPEEKLPDVVKRRIVFIASVFAHLEATIPVSSAEADCVRHLLRTVLCLSVAE